MDDRSQTDVDQKRCVRTRDELLTPRDRASVSAVKRERRSLPGRGNQLEVEEAQVRRERSLLRHWTLACVAYTMLQMQRLDAGPPGLRPTWRQTCRRVQKQTSLSFWMEWAATNFSRFVSWLAHQHDLQVNQAALAPAG